MSRQEEGINRIRATGQLTQDDLDRLTEQGQHELARLMEHAKSSILPGNDFLGKSLADKVTDVWSKEQWLLRLVSGLMVKVEQLKEENHDMKSEMEALKKIRKILA